MKKEWADQLKKDFNTKVEKEIFRYSDSSKKLLEEYYLNGANMIIEILKEKKKESKNASKSD